MPLARVDFGQRLQGVVDRSDVAVSRLQGDGQRGVHARRDATRMFPGAANAVANGVMAGVAAHPSLIFGAVAAEA